MDQVLTMATWWGVLISLAALLTLFRQPVRWSWLLLAVFINAIYVASIFFLGDLIPLEQYFGELTWNWSGKIAAIATTLIGFIILRFASSSITFRDAGFTLHQNNGSVLPSLIVIAVMIGLVVGLSILAGGSFHIPGIEQFAYQATMPGLDEEPFYRGFLLAVLYAAIPSRGINLGDAEINWAGIVVTLLFGMGHGLAVVDGALSMQPINIVFTGILGFGLLWVRMRTGSLLLPIIGHNAINAIGTFI